MDARRIKKTEKKEGKLALITGITGQDGGYLTEFLIEKGYKVLGILRITSVTTTEKTQYFKKFGDGVELIYSDMTDFGELISILKEFQPDEIYNLAAQQNIKTSFDQPEYVTQVSGLGTLRILEALKITGLKTKYYNASSSELFGKQEEGKRQNETTPFYPRSPYAIAKLYGYWMCVNYREAYGIHASNGILFNHESERRSPEFVTRKITSSVAKIKLGKLDCLYLGNIDSKKDWSHAIDVVESMWLMLQQEEADDYCICSGEQHSVRQFCEDAFKAVDITIEWKGKTGTVEEYGIDTKTQKKVIGINPEFFRPTDTAFICGDPTKAEKKLGWKRKYTFSEMIASMVKNDLELVAQNKL
eukprot:gene10795-3412_t